jgi:protein-S-isoprenylcysteine O-methyltransferase Ste14
MLKRLVSRFGVVMVVAALVWLLATGSLLSPSPVVIAAQLLAVALAVSARVAFGRGELRVDAVPGSGPLLTRGPYAYVRHPMYAAALLLIWASILGHWSVPNGVVGLLATAMAAVRMPVEEALLRQQYPEYEAYAARTRRVVPFVL